MLTPGVTLALASLRRNAKSPKTGFVTNLFLVFGRERIKTVGKMDGEANTASQCGRAKAPNAQSERRSKFVNQIAGFHAKSFGHPQKRMKADPLFSPLDLADINRMQVGLFRQFFLAQSRRVAALANGIAQDFKLLRFAWHQLPAEQEGEKSDTPNTGLFCACPSMPKR